MSAKTAPDDGGANNGTETKKCRYAQFVEAATPTTKVKGEDIPLMEAMKVVRNELPSFSSLDPILQTIILESTGEHLVLAARYYNKVTSHQKMSNDADFIPHSVRFKTSLAAPASVRSSAGFKAASAKADDIVKECGLKLRDIFIDVSKLVCTELREQLLKSMVTRLPELGHGLSVTRGQESYDKHRMFVDLIEHHGDELIKQIAPGKPTKVSVMAAYKARHGLPALPAKSIAVPANIYAQSAASRQSGRTRTFDELETEMVTGSAQADTSVMEIEGVEPLTTNTSTVNATVPTKIGLDEGWLTQHRVQLLKDYADWIHCIYGKSWAKYLAEEEKIIVRKNLKKIRDEASKSALAEETTAILQRGDNLDHASLNALVAKTCKTIISASNNSKKKGDKVQQKGGQHAKKDARGQVGAAGQKKSDPPANPSKKQKSKGSRGKEPAVGGRGNASSSAGRGRGGGRSSNRSNEKGRGTSSGRGA